MDDAEKYDKLYAVMTDCWRRLFKNDDLQFFYVTLNGYKPPDPDPNAVAVQARIRASQQRAELADPLSHLAVGADTGEALDVHARDKRPIGGRLAKLVLKYDFGRDIVADSPIFKSASRNGAEVTLTFVRVGGGLVAHPGKTEYVTQGRRANENTHGAVRTASWSISRCATPTASGIGRTTHISPARTRSSYPRRPSQPPRPSATPTADSRWATSTTKKDSPRRSSTWN